MFSAVSVFPSTARIIPRVTRRICTETLLCLAAMVNVGDETVKKQATQVKGDALAVAKGAEAGADDVPVNPADIARTVWAEIDKLRDDIPPPDPETKHYGDSRAADAFQAADQAVASLCAVPREKMLEGFTKLVEGRRLDDLLNALVASEEHPALQHSCLMVMCGVASLADCHDAVAQRSDVLKSLLAALAAPKPHRISPEGAEEDLDVNPAVGAAICLNSLLVSCGGLSPETIKTWIELDGLAAITSALESHTVFEGGGDEDVLPAMLFGLATPLLLHGKSSNNTNGGIEASSGNATAAPVKDEGAAATAEKVDAGGAGNGEQQMEVDERARAGRQRLAEAFLRLLAERREWVARSLAMAANASPTDLSGGAVAAPAPVTINNLLVNSLAHPDLLGRYTHKAPVRLRAQAVAAARKCQQDGTFAVGFDQQLARLLGLGGQKENQRRMAGMTVDKINKKQAARTPVVKCARPSCGKKQGAVGEGNEGGGSVKFKVCSRCQSACYCSGECQAAHWKEGHKRECKKK